ncbi:MAG TPA: GNAT family protein [Aggregatilineaceae bacterium]|nr:GNAT family N-acetyltransferase [Anaerolineae bacterium]HMM27366.1 GNAT family protein [Aggregatilineaceae bacterium]
MLAEGVLVDLALYDRRFLDLEHRWFNDEGIFWWAIGSRWFITKTMLERDRAEEADEPDHRMRFGLQAKDGTPLGLFGINWLPAEHRTALLTAFIGDPAYWGGGYGTDGLLLLVEYAFDWLDVRRVWLMTMSLNERVMRQMEKTGFRLEVRQRQATWAAGDWRDLLAYSLARDEWPGRAALVERLRLRPRQEP